MPRLANRYGLPPTEIARRIRSERERLGLTQAACAELLGLTNRQGYATLETVANPQLATLVALVKVLGMDPRALVPEVFAGEPAGVPARALSLIRVKPMAKTMSNHWKPMTDSDAALARQIAGSAPAPLDELVKLAAEHKTAVVFRGDLKPLVE